MEISTLLLRVAFLAFPGIIGSAIYRKLRGGTDRKTWEELTEILFFAIASYLVVHAVERSGAKLLTWYQSRWTSATQPVVAPAASQPADDRRWIVDAFVDEKLPIRWATVGWGSLAAVVLACLAGRAYRGGWLMRFARWSKISNRSGHDDHWEYFCNLPAISWVFVRDYKANVVYFGRLHGYSEAKEDRELVLSEVVVYNNLDPIKRLYEVDLLYISRSNCELSIEVPKGEFFKPEIKEKESMNGGSGQQPQDRNQHAGQGRTDKGRRTKAVRRDSEAERGAGGSAGSPGVAPATDDSAEQRSDSAIESTPKPVKP